MADGGETFDAVDLEVESEGCDLTDTRDLQQPLDVGVGDEVRVERLLQTGDLIIEELDLLLEAAGLDLGELGESVYGGDVVFLEQAFDGVSGADLLANQVEAGAQEITQRQELGTHHVGRGNQAGAQQLGERERIDRIGLHLRVGDRLEELGMGQRQRDTLLGQ